LTHQKALIMSVIFGFYRLVGFKKFSHEVNCTDFRTVKFQKTDGKAKAGEGNIPLRHHSNSILLIMLIVDLGLLAVVNRSVVERESSFMCFLL